MRTHGDMAVSLLVSLLSGVALVLLVFAVDMLMRLIGASDFNRGGIDGVTYMVVCDIMQISARRVIERMTRRRERKDLA